MALWDDVTGQQPTPDTSSMWGWLSSLFSGPSSPMSPPPSLANLMIQQPRDSIFPPQEPGGPQSVTQGEPGPIPVSQSIDPSLVNLPGTGAHEAYLNNLQRAATVALSVGPGAIDRAPAVAAEAKFPQYAESYPPVGPPTPTVDPRKGTTFLAKTLTPEAEAFAAERQRIMSDMAKSDWTPYYDPAQRFNVDPANYPSPADTATVVPAKQATVEKHLANIGSEQARANLQAGYERGLTMPDASNWYAMGQLEQDFINKLGPEAGRQAFQDRFAASMAATTGGAPPTSNYLLSSYLNYLRENNLPYPQNAYDLPYPIGGGKYGVMPNVAQHQRLFETGSPFTALDVTNPKRYDFAHSFTGDLNRPVMDEQMVSTMTPGLASPPSNTYGLYGQVVREQAANAGVLPGDYQDVTWAGIKNLKDPRAYPTGKPMIQEINESIERTHQLTGMPREEIVRRGVIGGQIPLYGLLGAVGLGAAGEGTQ